MKSDTEIIVRYAETDQMKVVHHSVYPIWFEAARTDYMEKAGYPYSRIEKEGVMLPLSRLECDFREGAKYGDIVLIKTSIKKFSPVRIELKYKAYRKSDGALLAEGETLHAWTDENLKIINLKKRLPDLYKLLENEVEKQS
ncbi:MAG: acyl-CoA thioesterase [Spirochaetaceae bacterium]|nr:acyl-CoA thioesterase [Spirochaetaceae bacterium]MCL2705413.1 acyl-CoA thioesterase [Spirochaetaceae bacterium]